MDNKSKTIDSSWRPPFWQEEKFSSSWERVKTALMRDWQQTKHDMHAGGHELRQNVGDTVKQASGKEAIPANDGLNPAKVIDTLADHEIPLGYGYGARSKYGNEFKTWSSDLEQKLKADWEGSKGPAKWEEIKDKVKYGFDYKH
jgi:hypothetical protein